NKLPLDFATIHLLNASDSSVLRTAVSDLNGKFKLETPAPGNYLVSINMIGYVKTYSRAFTLTAAKPSTDLGEIQVSPDSQMLGEVTVRAVKPFIERKIDRLVVNVENSSVAAGSNALEILQRAPGVTVDQNDNIAMQGKQGVLVML